MKSANSRNEHYQARTDAFKGTTGLATILTPMSVQQKANFETRCREFTAKQVLCNDIVSLRGVPNTSFVFYQAFNGEMYRAWLSSAGIALQQEAANLIVKYVARGLDTTVLENIRSTVWSVGPVITP
jgi:hypothetical protein